MPVVFDFHGSGGTAAGQMSNSGLAKVAGEYGFIVVFPQGAYTNSRSSRSWNADLDIRGVDDVAFVEELIALLRSELAIDESRIYATGFSGGARMTSRLACELSDRLAAIAPVAGIQFADDCGPQRPIPVLTFHSRDDQVNHYVPTTASAPSWTHAVEESIARWREANQCSASLLDDPVPEHVMLRRWMDCAEKSVVEFYRLENGGHTWPGSANTAANKDIDAGDLIWNFFARYYVPAPVSELAE
jgi:polyhydroxybutyrate depolymerase